MIIFASICEYKMIDHSNQILQFGHKDKTTLAIFPVSIVVIIVLW